MFWNIFKIYLYEKRIRNMKQEEWLDEQNVK